MKSFSFFNTRHPPFGMHKQNEREKQLYGNHTTTGCRYMCEHRTLDIFFSHNAHGTQCADARTSR
jgi:hypothetical protein